MKFVLYRSKAGWRFRYVARSKKVIGESRPYPTKEAMTLALRCQALMQGVVAMEVE